jgi:hypothetical protein
MWAFMMSPIAYDLVAAVTQYLIIFTLPQNYYKIKIHTDHTLVFDKLHPEPKEMNDPWYEDWTAWLVSDTVKLVPTMLNLGLYIATIAMAFYYVDNSNTYNFM